MKTLDRELARAKVSANRVAVVVANEWKDANDKVMPVKQWLEDRRFMQVGVLISSLFFFTFGFPFFFKIVCMLFGDTIMIFYREKCNSYVISFL